MLQIISGKFFPGTGTLNERECHAILFSNFNFIGRIETPVATLIPASPFSQGAITSYVLKYTHRWESQPGGVLVLPNDADVPAQFRLLASFWFKSFFYPDKGYVELLCRTGPRDAQDHTVPRFLVPNYFDTNPLPSRAGEVQGFSAFVQRVMGLRREQYRLFMSCLTTFFDALEALGANFDLAYSMYVYLLEALSKAGKSQKPTWEDDYDDAQRKQLEKDFGKIDPAVAANIRAILLKNAFVKAKKTFMDCVISNVADSFFTTEAEHIRHALPKSVLKRALENLYKVRSGYVHNLAELYREMQVPLMVESSDVYYRDQEPYFTFSGLVRLVRHVLLSFLHKQEVVEKEPECSTWQQGMRGVVRAEMAPQYWAANEKTFHVSQAKSRLRGFLEHFVSSETKYLDMRPIMPRIESEISQAKREDVPALLALYGLFNFIIPEKDRQPNWEGFLGKYRAEMDKCGIELLTVRVLFSDNVPDWKTSEVLAVIDAYDRSKHNPNEMKFPRVIDLALLAAVANNQLAGNEMELFDSLTDRMLLDAAGMKPVQDHIRQAKEKGERMDLRTILGWPPAQPAEEAAKGDAGGNGEAVAVEQKPQEAESGVNHSVPPAAAR